MNKLINVDDAIRIVNEINTWSSGWRDYAIQNLIALASEQSVDEFIGRFNQEIIKLCDPASRGDDVIEIRGRLFIRIPTIGRLLIECVKRKDGE